MKVMKGLLRRVWNVLAKTRRDVVNDSGYERGRERGYRIGYAAGLFDGRAQAESARPSDLEHVVAADVFLNGRPILFPPRVSYADVVSMSGLYKKNATVTYRKAKDDAHGELSPGEWVDVRNGTVFNVAYTGNA